MRARSMAIVMTALMIATSMVPFAAGTDGQVPTGEDLPAESIGDTPSGIDGVSKDMTFYLHYVNDTETSRTVIDKSTWYYFDTTQEWNDVEVKLRISAAQQTLKWYLYPVLTDDVTITSFDFIIWAQRIGGAGHPNKVIKIFEKSEDNETLIHSKNHGAGPGIVAAPTEQIWGSDSTWGGHTFKAGNSVVMALELNPGAGNTFDFIFDTATCDSRVVFETADSMNVTSVSLLDSNDVAQGDLNPNEVNKTVRFRANVTDPYGGYDVKWVNITVRDPLGGTVFDNASMTKVVGSPNTFLNVYEMEWNYSGATSGTYQVTVRALDNNGYFYRFYDGNADFGNYYVRKDWDFSIGKVTFLNVKVADSMNVSLQGAFVVALLNDSKAIEGSAITNGSGMVNMSVFSAEWEIRVYWCNILVAKVFYSLTDDVTDDDPLEIMASVYYPNFMFKDGHGVALENASVTVVHANGTISSPVRTNSTGEFGLSQVPGGEYRLIVRWRDVEVNNTVVHIDDNTNHTVFARVHYMIIRARDDIGGALPGAQIVIANNTTTIVFDSKVTNLTGSITSRLPAGPYDIFIYWQHSLVYENRNLSFTSDMTIDAFTGIFVLNITALDGHLFPVSKARILVLTSTYNLLESNFTDPQGVVRTRLPRGSHIIRAYWRDILVNETIFDFDTNHDLTLSLDINYPTLRVIDEEGALITNCRLDLFYTGSTTLFGTTRTDETGEVIYKVPATEYDIRVTWHDRIVNLTSGLRLDSDDVYVIQASVHNLAIRVEDPHGEPVANALVEMSFSSGDEVGVLTTDAFGTSSIMLPADTYDIRVIWSGAIVHETTALVLQGGMEVTLVADIWYINITPVDSRDEVLDKALVTLYHSGSRIKFAAMVIPMEGYVVFRVPIGSFDIDVVWMGRMVFNGTGLVLLEDRSLELLCEVYHIEMSIVDSRGISVSGSTATVEYLVDGTEVVSEALIGKTTVTARLPRDSYLVTATWLGVVINTTEVMDLAEDLTLVLQARVYYLTVSLVDSREVPLVDATMTVSLTETGKGIDSSSTDTNGTARFRLPGTAPLDISVIWSNVQVLEETGYIVTADDEVTFQASVHYLGLLLVDSRGVPVDDAQVLLLLTDKGEVMATGTTTGGGKVEVRLPAERYDITVVWLGRRIHDDPMTVTTDTNVTVTVNVAYLTLRVADSRAVPLVGAWVNLAFTAIGTNFGAGLTDANGSLESRLPFGTYSIEVHWMGVMVASETSVTISGDRDMGIGAQVYYIDISVRDDRSIPVEDALVRAVLTSNASLSMVGATPLTGDITFRLPVGDFTVDVMWHGTQVATDIPVSMTQDKVQTVNARVFYLTFKAKDANGGGIRDVRVLVQDLAGLPVAQATTDGKGTAEFRLPVGTYDVRSRLVTTDMMNNVDIKMRSQVELTSSQEVVVKFSDYPAPIYATTAFQMGILMVILVVVLAMVIVVGLRRRRAAAEEGADMEEYPPDEAEDEPVELSEGEEGVAEEDVDTGPEEGSDEEDTATEDEEVEE